MRHFVLTRAAYGPGWDREANRRRIQLLAGVTAASLRQQTRSDFVWVVLLDERDELLDERAEVLQRQPLDVRVLFVQDTPDLLAEEPQRAAALAYRADWRKAIGPALEGALLTTRLDDDDALHHGYLESARGAAAEITERVILEWPYGYRVNGGRADPCARDRNAWVTLCAPGGDDAIVYDFNHRRRDGFAPVWRQPNPDPAWLWVRHEDALSGHRHASGSLALAMAEFPGVDWSLLR